MIDTTEQAPVVVIGAGIIGLAIAFRLAETHPNVILVDRAEPGMACSFGNAGHIATEQVFPLAAPATILKAPRLMLGRNRPLSIRPGYALSILPWLLRFAWASRSAAFRRGTQALGSLQSRALDDFSALCADAQIPRQVHCRGHLILVEDERLRRAASAQMRSMAEHGIEADWLSPEQVAAIAPELARNAGAIRVYGSAHVGDPLAVCRGIADAFGAAGGRVVRGDVRCIEQHSDGRPVVRLGDREISAHRVVIAAGAWSKPLAAQTGFDVPLDTERGYHVAANDWHGSFDIAIASLDRLTIMTPLAGGLRITGFVEFGGLELPPSPARLKTLHRHLSELLPGADLSDRSEWMGFRPSMPDHLPVIGRSPTNPAVYYAFGHQHLGLTLAGVTANAISALMTGQEAAVDLAPFRIDRF